MAPLRRRTGAILSSLLLACLVGALVGGVLVAFRDPLGCVRVGVIALFLAAGITRALDEGLDTFGILGVAFVILSLGLYALHVIGGLSGDAVMWIAGVVGALVVVILGRALVAAGSADYPYDDD